MAYAETPLSTAEVRARVDAFLRARREQLAAAAAARAPAPPKPKRRKTAKRKPTTRAPRKRGRTPPVVRERQRRGVFQTLKARELESGDVSPLRRLRLERNLTAAEAAKLAMLHERTIRRAEKGEPVSPATLARIAHGLGVAPEQLFE